MTGADLPGNRTRAAEAGVDGHLAAATKPHGRKKAIVIGASSGIGRAMALILSRHQFQVGATGRRIDLLEDLHAELSPGSMVRPMDVRDAVDAVAGFRQMIGELGGIDLVIISAGVGRVDPELSWASDEETIAVNVTGFTAIANAAVHEFERQGHGHLVGISSVAAMRGGRGAPAYNASKAFVSSYMEGLRHRIARSGLPIVVTDIRPGFVDTAMAQGDGLFWVQPAGKAARQIYAAIERKRKVAYITKRWALIAWLMRALPDAIYHRT